jgi:DNA-directed RNA polymerase specialized sigma24 family protein
VIVLRELESMSYKEITGLCDVLVGTVMSRRAKASQRLEPQFTGLVEKGALP